MHGFPPPAPPIWYAALPASIQVHPPHNSLLLTKLRPHHSLNYTCTARNTHNTAHIVWAVRVVGRPHPPTPFVQFNTETAIHITWTPSGEDGGMPVVAYIIRYMLMRPDLDDGAAEDLALDVSEVSPFSWREAEVEPGQSNFALQELSCGSTYRLQLLATNVVGRSEPSVHVTTRTRGAVPRAPRWQDLLSMNSSAIHVHLYTWVNGGCPITLYTVAYRPWGTSPGKETAQAEKRTEYPGTEDTVVLSGLDSGTWYHVALTAHNSAGATTRLYKVATAAITGALVSPSPVVEVVGEARVGDSLPPYLEPHVLAPVVSGAVCTLALLLCAAIAVTRSRSCLSPAPSKTRPREPLPPDAVGGRGLASLGSLFTSRGTAVRDTSREQLSPARAKQEEAYRVDDSPYEVSPYVSFVEPPTLTTPLSPDPAASLPLLAPLDHSLRFHTFGRDECCLEGYLGYEVSSHPSGGSELLLPCGGGSSTSGSSRIATGFILGPGELSCDAAGGGAPQGSSNEDYKVPVRIRRGPPGMAFPPPDSSTESNDDRSPKPFRRLPSVSATQHQLYQQYQQPQPHPLPVARQPFQQQQLLEDQQRDRLSFSMSTYAGDTSGTDTLTGNRRANTLVSVYSVDSGLSATGLGITDLAAPAGAATPLRPPSGFLDCREMSEAECDREQRPGIHKGRGNRIRRSLTDGSRDYTIHV